MAALATQDMSLAGLTPAYGATAAGGDTFTNDGRTHLHFKNPTGAAITVTVNSVTACDQGFDHDVVRAIAAAAEAIIGPFDVGRFGVNPSITYSAAGLTVAVVRRP